jgi:hypothetical protein
MPTRIVKFLDEMDVLREQINVGVDEHLKKVNIKLLVNRPDKVAEAFKQIIMNYMFNKDTKQLIAKARLEGKKLAKTL